MYLAVGMFPSCYMSSGGKLAPCNRGVNQFFTANEALADAPHTTVRIRRRPGRPAHDGNTGRIDVQTRIRVSQCTSPGTRAAAGLHAYAAITATRRHATTYPRHTPHPRVLRMRLERLNDRQTLPGKIFCARPSITRPTPPDRALFEAVVARSGSRSPWPWAVALTAAPMFAGSTQPLHRPVE